MYGPFIPFFPPEYLPRTGFTIGGLLMLALVLLLAGGTAVHAGRRRPRLATAARVRGGTHVDDDGTRGATS